MFRGRIDLLAVVVLFAALAGSLHAQTMDWVEEMPGSPATSEQPCIEFNNRMWRLGGYLLLWPLGGPQNDIYSSADGSNWQVEPATGHWSARGGHGAVAFNGRMWVLGGNDGVNYLNDVWSSADGVNWHQEPASNHWDPRANHSVAVFDNRIWVVGGEDDTGTPVNDIWSSADGVSWNPEPAAGHWAPRFYHATEVFDGRLWVMGGADSRTAPTLMNDIWSSADGVNWVQAPASGHWSPRRSHSATVYNGRVWVMGGRVASDTSSEVWSSVDGTNWTLAVSSAQWGWRAGHASLVFDRRLWVVVGEGNPVGMVWSYGEPMMQLERSTAPVANGGVDMLGPVSAAGQVFTWEVRNAGTVDLELPGTPLVSVTPGAGAPAVSVITQPTSPVAPSGTTTFQIEVTPSIGAFDFVVSIESNDGGTSPYQFTVEGIGFSPNQPGQADPAPGSTLAGGTNGPFTLVVDPGEALTVASIILTDPESDTINVLAISAVGTLPAGIIAPSVPAPGHPLTLSWTGMAESSNPPGDYIWDIEFVDAGNGTPVTVGVIITIKDLEPQHNIADAISGDGSQGDPYRFEFAAGDDVSLIINLCAVSDPNTGQSVSLGLVTPANPASPFDFDLTAGTLRVAPSRALVDADGGGHGFIVQITDGANDVDIHVSLLVYGNAGVISFVATTLPNATTGSPYSANLSVAGGQSPYRYTIIAGSLPGGLVLDSNTGAITGTPTAPETAAVTIGVVDAANDTALRQFSLNVSTPGTSTSSSGCTAASVGLSAWLPLAFFALLALRRRRGSQAAD